MALQIIGGVKFNEASLSLDVERIKAMPFSEAYSEYAIGHWRTAVLANRSGSIEDSLSVEYEGSAKLNENGKQVPYLISVVEQLFQWRHLKSARVFHCKTNSMIIPHRDYLEFKNGFTRIHIPIVIDSESFNTENDKIYSMKKGEIWFLDGREVHSAGAFGKSGKYTLVLDFDPNIAIEQLFNSPSSYQPSLPVETASRTKLDAAFMNQIIGLHHVISDANFNDVVAILAKVHFFKQVASQAMFDWLLQICQASSNPALIHRAQQMRLKFLGVKAR